MARRRAGLTQRELAARLGVRQATVARWERSDRQVAMEDIEAAAAACGLHLESRLVVDDRSWWPQIALQLELDPLDRVRRLTPPGAPDVAAALSALAVSADHIVVIGEVAGALHGWPLIIDGGSIEVCAQAADGAPLLTAVGPQVGRRQYELPGGARMHVVPEPPGTAGLTDLWRGSEPFATAAADVRVASLVDLLRIADASPSPGARRQALAYQAVLDVMRARAENRAAGEGSAAQRIDAWLKRQAPVST
jgi:transcriptional regulator with XRE-family HTH domain